MDEDDADYMEGGDDEVSSIQSTIPSNHLFI